MSDQDIQDAPQVQTSASPAPSNLAQAVSQMPTLNESGDPNNDFPTPPSGGSRLLQIIGAVARVGTTALASIPSHGRPSFLNGATEGARGALASEANQQAIKFRSFDDSLRAAQLHNDDLRIQNQTQAQQDAHIAAENTQRDYDDDHNIEYNPHPSVGDAVVQTLQARTQADPAGASIAPGTYHSADGNTIMEPNGSDETNAGLTQKYRELQSVLNLPVLQPGSQYVSGKNLDMMGKVLKGSDMGGKPLSKEALQNYLAGRDAQRAALVSSKASPFALQTFDNLTNIYKADLKNHQDFEDQATAANAKAKKTGELAAQPQVDPNDVQTFTGTTLQGYSHISAGVQAGLKAEALQAKTQADLDKVQTKALTMEQSGQVHADTVAATQTGKQTAQQNAGLVANEKLLNDPHTGVLGALAQLNQTTASIKAGADGNALITNMVPTMEVLGINHTAGITRISPAEATAAGTSPDWATRWNAFAQKASTGKISPELANEGNQLMNILKQGALTKLYQQQSVLAKGRGIDPSTLPSVDAQGNITSFDQIATKQQQTAGHKVGDTITQNGRTFTVTSVDANGKVTGAR